MDTISVPVTSGPNVILILVGIWYLFAILSGWYAVSRSRGITGNIARVWAVASLIAVVIVGRNVPQGEIVDHISSTFEATTVIEFSAASLIWTLLLQLCIVFGGPFLAVWIHGNHLYVVPPELVHDDSDQWSEEKERAMRMALKNSEKYITGKWKR